MWVQLVATIKELLDTRIKPVVHEVHTARHLLTAAAGAMRLHIVMVNISDMQDGGDIEYHGFDQDTGIVYLKMKVPATGLRLLC